MFDVKDFGAVGDGVTYDDGAFTRTLDAIAALSTASSAAGDADGPFTRITDPVGPILFVPRGTYRLSQPLNLVRQLELRGEGGTGVSEGNSQLFFDPPRRQPADPPVPCTGIVVHVPRTVPGFDPDKPAGRADGSVIIDLAIMGNSSNPAADSVPPGPLLPDGTVDLSVPLDELPGHGIVLFGRAHIVRCSVSNFAVDGIHIATDPKGVRNANAWQVHASLLWNNGRHGLYAQGEDANGGLGLALDAEHNCGAGIYDRSFLGNTYVACQAAENMHGGGYNTSDTNAISRSVFVGCYAEGDNPALLGAGSLVLGGVLSVEVTAGSPATVLGAGEITPLSIRNHLLGGGATKTVVVTLGGDGSGYGEVFGFQSVDDDPGLDHPDGSGPQTPGNRYVLRYEGPQLRDKGWWELTYAATPAIAPLSISGPQAANAAGTTLGTGWLRLGPIDGAVQIGGSRQLPAPPAPLTVLGPIATTIRRVDAATGVVQPVADDDSVLLADASAAPHQLVISLPAARNREGRQYTIKKIDTTPIPVHIESTVDQLESGVVDLTTPLESVIAVSDGTQWWITARN